MPEKHGGAMNSTWLKRSLLLGGMLLTCGVHAACTSLSYATNPGYPPYDWSPDQQHYQGASIDLLRQILPPGVTAIPVVYPWKRAQQMAKEGRIDLLLSLRRTPEREQYLLFTTHRAFPNPIAVFVRRGHLLRLDNWQQLIPMQGGVSRGDTFGGGFDDFLKEKLTVEEAATMAENFEKLRRGRIDYFVTSQYAGNFYLLQTGLSHEIVALPPHISDESIHMGFSRNSPCQALEPYLSSRLRELDREGRLETLLVKYLQHPLP
jgi:polar amino acid transport system substrate-binding protein